MGLKQGKLGDVTLEHTLMYQLDIDLFQFLWHSFVLNAPLSDGQEIWNNLKCSWIPFVFNQIWIFCLSFEAFGYFWFTFNSCAWHWAQFEMSCQDIFYGVRVACCTVSDKWIKFDKPAANYFIFFDIEVKSKCYDFTECGYPRKTW